MRTNHWKLKSAVVAGLLLAGAGMLGNACSGDDNAGPGVVVPDGGNPTAGAGGAGGSSMTAGTGGGGTGGAGGSTGDDGGEICPANGAGSFDNTTRLMGLLGPDGGILPL